MKTIVNDILPFKGFKAMNVFGVLLVRRGARMAEKDYTHEAIHTAQMKETLWVGFYVWYGVEWLVRLVANGFKAHAAYRALLMEREAYGHEGEAEYLAGRRRWAWLRDR